MTCYHPVKSLLNEEAQKGHRLRYNCKNYHNDAIDWYLNNGYRFVDLPCGKCIGCFKNNCADWTVRLLGQYNSYLSDVVNNPLKQFSFITLTYAPEYYPNDAHKNLHLDELSKFFHRVNEENRRQGLPSPLYFGCAERGEKNGRLHYHAIVFGEDFLHNNYDGEVRFIYEGGRQYYSTPKLRKLWKYGRVAVDPSITPGSCAYVTGYMKKQGRIGISFDVDKSGDFIEVYHDRDKVRTSGIRCSKGLGKEFLLKHLDQFVNQGYIRDWLKCDKLYGLPRYIKKIIKESMPDYYEIMQNRSNAYFESSAFKDKSQPSVRMAQEYMSLQRLYNGIRPLEDKGEYCQELECKLLY